MDSSSTKAPNTISHDFRPFFLVHNDGRIERLIGGPRVPPSDDPLAAVRSKDVSLSPEVSVRIYLSASTGSRKLPVLLYIHGGGFCADSASSATYHEYVNSVVAAADVAAVSVEYRLAPEHPIPACYEDSWTALQWVAQHVSGQGPDPWLNESADLSRIFLAGDSAGANIAHDLATRFGQNGSRPGFSLSGLILIHPYFGNNKPNKLCDFLCKKAGRVDPRLESVGDPSLLARVGCGRVLVCVAERDFLIERGWNYYKALEESDWNGVVEIKEIEGEGHVFHLSKPNCDNSKVLMNQIVSFINQI